MTDQPLPPDEVLPCGCRLECAIVEGRRTVHYRPCAVDCEHYAAMLEVAGERRIPVTVRDERRP